MSVFGLDQFFDGVPKRLSFSDECATRIRIRKVQPVVYWPLLVKTIALLLENLASSAVLDAFSIFLGGMKKVEVGCPRCIDSCARFKFVLREAAHDSRYALIPLFALPREK